MEITKDFEFRDLAYNYANGISISLSGAGRYTVASESDLSSEDGPAMNSDFMTALKLVLNALAAQNADHTTLPHKPDEFSELMHEAVSDTWSQRGWELKRVFFTALYPDESSVMKLIEANRMLSLRCVCPNCGKDLTDNSDAVFCSVCGTRLEPTKTQLAVRTPVEEYILANFSEVEKVEAIKYYRQETGANLAAAKAAVEQLYKKDSSQYNVTDFLFASDMSPEARMEYLSTNLNNGIQKLKNFFGGEAQ
ncbi:MAG: zinc-ribbon domain-containing protein [Lachnospiraceae bacterium]|nr:zinc-ribbon domain-containing protein [Lachnospiraceae bacterium]